eukprot:scaffold672738_cov104-Prasinocladus_malaysianus.AAC.1
MSRCWEPDDLTKIRGDCQNEFKSIWPRVLQELERARASMQEQASGTPIEPPVDTKQGPAPEEAPRMPTAMSNANQSPTTKPRNEATGDAAVSQTPTDALDVQPPAASAPRRRSVRLEPRAFAPTTPTTTTKPAPVGS